MVPSCGTISLNSLIIRRSINRLAPTWVRAAPIVYAAMYAAVRALKLRRRTTMSQPSYLQRRNGGLYHFQMRLPKALATCLGWSHLRCALRTTDLREARRRMLTMLDWVYEFRDAPTSRPPGRR